MKRNLIILLILIIPVLAIADYNINPFGNHNNHSTVMNSPSRAWRLTDKLDESYVNTAWQSTSKSTYYYVAAHPAAIDSTQNFVYNSLTSAWTYSGSTMYTYDASYQFVTLLESFDVIGTTSITPVLKEILQYNNLNYLTNVSVEIYNSAGGTWNTAYRLHILYSNNNISSFVVWSEAIQSIPAHYEKSTFSFDSQGRIIDTIKQTSPDSTSWVNDERFIRTFDSHDTSTGATFIYDLAHLYALAELTGNDPTFGKISQETTQTWTNNAWVNTDLDTYTYNSSGNLTNHLAQTWNGTGWDNSTNDIYTYDTNSNLYQDLSQQWYLSAFNNTTRVTYNWENVVGNDDGTAVVSPGLMINAYPNPFNEIQNVKVSSRSNQPVQFEIYNVKGQQVFRSSFMPNAVYNWDTNNLPSGVYLMKTKQGDNSITHKIMKLK